MVSGGGASSRAARLLVPPPPATGREVPLLPPPLLLPPLLLPPLASVAALLLQSHRLVLLPNLGKLPNLGAPNSHSALVHGMTAPIGSCPSWPTVIDV